MNEKIIIKGAKVHNLKNVDLELPRNKLIVFTGISGSGKSSLAFDTIYAEGQRRYVESLSAYARQFLGQMDKPDVDSIEGLSPAISIDQKTTSKNPRSTVGTITEIYDYLRLLYANVAIPHCPKCGKEIQRQTVQEIVDQILKLKEGTKIQVLSPIVRGRKGEYTKLLQDFAKDGFVRVRVDGEMHELSERIRIDKKRKHNIEIVIDRLVIKEGIRKRLTDSVEIALQHAQGVVLINAGAEELIFSESFACNECGISMPELTPRMFSFNNPYGACPECKGLGFKQEFDVAKIVPDPNLSLNDGAIYPWRTQVDGWRGQQLEAVAKHFHFSLDIPFKKLSKKHQEIILYGSEQRIRYHYQSFMSDSEYKFQGRFEGVIPMMERLYKQTESESRKEELEEYMAVTDCPVCNGEKLNEFSRKVTFKKTTINQLTHLSIKDTLKFFKEIDLTEREKLIARQVIKEISERLNFLVNVGLDYLSLDRRSATLSGGESQRIRLATQIGSGLVGVLYILDEPSIGLHQRDNKRLISTLLRLRDLGNTLIVVEHDEETIRSAEHIVDIGPGAGIHGGEIVENGTLEKVINNPGSLTGKYLSGEKQIQVPNKRRPPKKFENKGKKETVFLSVFGATEHNLKNIDVHFPLGQFVCVTGVSGSGKSTLISDILHKAIAQELYQSSEKPGAHIKIQGLKHIDKVIVIDQAPIGRTPRSNPATYTGLFAPIRELFSLTVDAKLRGYKPGRFSFNVKGGRCEACEGDGIIKIEMHFLPDVYVPCEICKCKRYNRETLEVLYKGRNIHDVLEMTVEEALKFFENIPSIKNKLQTLNDVGLHYIHLGQSATTLSGGEAQRVKLATELSKRSTGRTMYLLDEPTTGLHFDDIRSLLNVLNRLVEKGNTVIVIEHNLDVIKTADYIIDLGPEGGDLGGEIVAIGTPEEIAGNPKSYTGQFLKKMLKC
ncbi:MAG: excinuclease ABC subunit UvrA [Candidatus Margulisbacteria bacterium]|nr:excinuclease ABC subunit UvrA [Candidatus Margulisiibacteriota bacterium]